MGTRVMNMTLFFSGEIACKYDSFMNLTLPLRQSLVVCDTMSCSQTRHFYLNNALHPLELETLRSFEGGREGRSFVTCIGVTFYMVKIRGIIFLVLMIQKLE